ncbi:MAG: AraC family transcriptional regulator [Lachnospiraceae bacterium]|nr:AraC family transcriptional regulator [Lachnospiraceae bacterium]
MKEIKLYKFYRNKYGVEQLCDALGFDAIKSGIVRFPTHRESFYCIIMVEEGTTRLRLNGIEKVICPTDVVCGLPGEVWEWEEDPRIKGKVVIFEPDFLLSAVKDPLLLQRPGFLRSTNHSPFISVSEKGFSLIRDIIIEMIEEVASRNKFYDLLRAQLWHLILLVEKEYQQAGHEIKELPVRNYATGFVNLVGAELYRHHDVEYYADRLCITANYLNKISHSSLGVSARAYIQSRIIAEAKNLINITTMNISQVANTLGFETANYFIRFFKKQTGITPGEYRTKIQ